MAVRQLPDSHCNVIIICDFVFRRCEERSVSPAISNQRVDAKQYLLPDCFAPTAMTNIYEIYMYQIQCNIPEITCRYRLCC